jgi:hypothetical protein
MKTVQPKFVEFIPEQIEEGILYVSISFCTAVHRCACGCGEEVVTPISRTDWHFSFNGESISLSPSIGNWNFPCRSHYWITNNQVRYSKSWTDEQVEQGRKRDEKKKNNFFAIKAKQLKIPNWKSFSSRTRK